VKTTAVYGVLTSYELMLTIYLCTSDGMLDRAALTSITCGSDAVTDPVSGWIITGQLKDNTIGF